MGEDNTTKWLSSIDLVLDNNIEDNSYYHEIKNFDSKQFDILQQHLRNSKYIVYSIRKGWEEDWFNIPKIQDLIDNGYIPVFNYLYFGDNLGSSLPTTEEIEAYSIDNIALGKFLNMLNGTKLLIIEPEFNTSFITDASAHQDEFARIISNTIDIVKRYSDNVLVSLCMEDKGRRDANDTANTCGYAHCALGDKEAWSLPKIVYTTLLDKIDFISFQEKVGQFHRDPDNKGSWSNPIPISNTDNSSGINFLAQRISNFAYFLQKKYQKPIFLPYIAIPTASWQDNNQDGTIQSNEVNLSGWETKANKVYKDLILNKEELIEHKLFGIATMSLFDDPQNDINGYQYFMHNEYHMGLIKSSAKDEVDSHRLGDIKFKSDIINLFFGKNLY